MPEDTTEEVSEQEGLEKPDIPADETAAFVSEEDIDDGIEGLEQPEEKVDTDKKDDPDKKVDEKPGELDKEGDEVDADKGDEDDELDEDITRGKELLVEQEKAEADQKALDQANRQTRADAGAYDPLTEKHDAKSIEFFKSVIPENLLPETVTLEDGTELDFGDVIKDTPEIPVMISIIANNIVRQMIANKYLATTEDIAGLDNNFNNRLFLRTVTNKQDGVPDAKKIYNSPEFKKWVPEQSKEVQALFKSSNPNDHIRGYKRFLNKSGIEDAKKKIDEIDSKRKKGKEKFDGIHKTTIKSKKGKPGKSSLDPRDEVLAGFNEKDDDDDFYS